MGRFLLLTVFAIGCAREPQLPPPDLEGCELVCERYAALGCNDGDTDGGAPCSAWCPNAFGVGELNVRCVREALTCEALDSCE